MLNEYPSPLVLYIDNQSVTVAFDVEHGIPINRIGMRINLAHVRDVFPVGTFYYSVPSFKGAFQIPVDDRRFL